MGSPEGRAKSAQPDQSRAKTRRDGSVGIWRHRGGIGMWAAGTVGLAGHTPGKGTAGDPRMRGNKGAKTTTACFERWVEQGWVWRPQKRKRNSGFGKF